MPVERQQVGQTESYKGRKIVARLAGPDLLAYVDGIELSGFYLNTAAVSRAGRRHVDAEIKAEEEKAKKK